MKRLSDDPAVRLAECRGESVPPAGEVEVLRKRLEAARSRFGRWNDRLIDSLREERAHVTRLTADNDALRKRYLNDLDLFGKCQERENHLEAEVERLTAENARLKGKADEFAGAALKFRDERDALQSELTKAIDLLAFLYNNCEKLPNGKSREIKDFLAHQSAPAAKDKDSRETVDLTLKEPSFYRNRDAE